MLQNDWSEVHNEEIQNIKFSRWFKKIPIADCSHSDNIINAHEAKLVGMAFSGGGIRSAIFNLGILQGLANLNLLHILDYLSTVSGGGYIGSWFSALLFRSFDSPDLDFKQNDFNKNQLKELCTLIEKDNYDLSLRNKPKTIEWLNELLTTKKLYQEVKNKKNFKFSKKIEKLNSITNSAMKKNRTFVNLVKRLNRLILEEVYNGIASECKQHNINNSREKLGSIIHRLKTNDINSFNGEQDPNKNSEINFLRKYSNYLTPRRGFTTDSLALGVSYMINLILNLVILLLIFASILTIPLLFVFLYYWLASISSPLILGICSVLSLGISVFCAYNIQSLGPDKEQAGDFKKKKGKLLFLYVFVTFFLFTSGLFSIFLLQTSQLPQPYKIKEWIFNITGVFVLCWLFGRCKDLWRLFRIKEKSEKKRQVQVLASEFFAALFSGILTGPLFFLAVSVIANWQKSFSVDTDVSAIGFSVLGLPLVVLIFGLSTVAYMGICGRNYTENWRELTYRLWAILINYTFFIGGFLIITVYGPYLMIKTSELVKPFLTGWILTSLGAVLAGKVKLPQGKKLKILVKVITNVGPYIFVVGLVLFLSWILHEFWITILEWLKGWKPFSLKIDFNDLGKQEYWIQIRLMLNYWFVPLIGSFVFFLLALFLSSRVGTNKYSLNAIYGNRLVRAFLGASNKKQYQRNPITFFNPSDNDVKLSSLSSLNDKLMIYPGPYHIINTTINLVKSPNLAWQKRKGASFIFTPLYSGYDRKHTFDERSDQQGGKHKGAYIPSLYYSDEEGVSLGKAMTVSGAAASPNMGYYTSVPIAFLMTIFNLRLGWWLRNPLKGDANTLKDKDPKLGFLYLLNELLARAGENSNYIYLSDGGHFENLGLYELVKRRCRYIIACDASRDKDLKFNDLGNAIEKCRTDFGIDIMINVEPIRKQGNNNKSTWHCAIGTVCYSAVDENAQDGVLFYIKASLTGDEPLDIERYASQYPDFPHQSTADQWFDETQFESYRRLGEHIARVAFQDAANNDRVFLNDKDSNDENTKLAEINVERLFHELKKQWYPPIPSLEKAFARHASGLESIISRLKADDNLRFLDQQMYPDIGKLDKLFPESERLDEYLPKSGKELRAGFYMCKEMLVFMESVYHDLNLDEYFEHPDNRGWINLFRRWAWSRMFRFTWSVTASTFGARFQTFCEQKLKFKKGAVKVGIDKKGIPRGLQVKCNIIKKYLLQKPNEEIFGGAYTSEYLGNFMKNAENKYGFNYFETKLLISLIKANPKPCIIYPLFIRIEDNPLKDKLEFDFNIGFIMMDYSQKEMYYFRIQNHLRKMGLARESLLAFLSDEYFYEKRINLNLVRPSFDTPEVPSKKEWKYFEMLFQMVKSDVGTIHSKGKAKQAT